MNLNDRSFKPYNKQNDTIPYKKNVIILLIISTLFRMGGGGGGGSKKALLTSFPPVTSTNVVISPKNIFTFGFNPFAKRM